MFDRNNLSLCGHVFDPKPPENTDFVGVARVTMEALEGLPSSLLQKAVARLSTTAAGVYSRNGSEQSIHDTLWSLSDAVFACEAPRLQEAWVTQVRCDGTPEQKVAAFSCCVRAQQFEWAGGLLTSLPQGVDVALQDALREALAQTRPTDPVAYQALFSQMNERLDISWGRWMASRVLRAQEKKGALLDAVACGNLDFLGIPVLSDPIANKPELANSLLMHALQQGAEVSTRWLLQRCPLVGERLAQEKPQETVAALMRDLANVTNHSRLREQRATDVLKVLLQETPAPFAGLLRQGIEGFASICVSPFFQSILGAMLLEVSVPDAGAAVPPNRPRI